MKSIEKMAHEAKNVNVKALNTIKDGTNYIVEDDIMYIANKKN